MNYLDEQREHFQRLMKLPKGTLIREVRRYWLDGAHPPEKWTKDELAHDIVEFEEGRLRYAAYGNVALHNNRPASGTRPHCGGINCTGHSLPALPWPEVRGRHTEDMPCVGDLPAPTGPPLARVRILRDITVPSRQHANTVMQFKAGSEHELYRWRDYTSYADETRWWTTPEDPSPCDTFAIPNDAVEIISDYGYAAGKDTGAADESTPRPDYRKQKQLLVMARILETGCRVTLGTTDSRRAFMDGVPELAALLLAQFTPQELNTIMDGGM